VTGWIRSGKDADADAISLQFSFPYRQCFAFPATRFLFRISVPSPKLQPDD
jgi:hypothetical protein